MSKRQIRPGENMSDARARWETERRQQISLEKSREKLEIEKAKTKEKEEKLRIEREIQELEKRELELQESLIIEPLIIMPPPMEYIPGDKKLSILICSIKGREELLQKLVNSIKRQSIKNMREVEILIEIDSKKITTGMKRNLLLERARGDYICFVDDDDKISEDYVTKILEAIKSKPDCCSLEGQLKRRLNRKQMRAARRSRGTKIMAGGILISTFIHSLKYKTWFERRGIYYRCPNHLNVVRRELAYQVGFPDISQGEDMTYSLNLFPLLKTEAKIKGPIYFYEKL